MTIMTFSFHSFMRTVSLYYYNSSDTKKTGNKYIVSGLSVHSEIYSDFTLSSLYSSYYNSYIETRKNWWCNSKRALLECGRSSFRALNGTNQRL